MTKVGYGSPPTNTRWKKGQSGNPRGRPKGTASLNDAVMEVLAEVIQITEGGKVKRITKLVALIKSVTASGIKGDARAANLILSWCARAIEANPAVEDERLTPAQQVIVDAYLEEQVERRLAEREDL